MNRLLLIVSTGFLTASPALAQRASSASQPPELQKAAQAMKDQLPEVAAAKLERLLDQPGLPAPTKASAMTMLAEAWVRARKPEKALAVTGDAALKASSHARFWRALALQSLGRWKDAEQILAILAKDSQFPLRAEAVMNHAAVLTALGDAAGARAELSRHVAEANSPEAKAQGLLWLANLLLAEGKLDEATAALTQAGSPPPIALESVIAYLKGRIDLTAGRAQEAGEKFSLLAGRKKNISLELNHAAVLGWARAQQMLGDSGSALRILVEFIEQNPSSPMLGPAFRELTRVNSPPLPATEAQLRAWTASDNQFLANEADLALASALDGAGKTKEAADWCASFEKRRPQSPLAARAALLHATFLIKLGMQQEALSILDRLKEQAPQPAVQAWIAHLQASAKFDLKAFQEAAGLFSQSAKAETSETKKSSTLYNAAVAALYAGGTDALAEFDKAAAPESSMRGDFQLERGLFAAGRGNREAEEILRSFLKNSPTHPRAFEALLGLAELALESDPFDLDKAKARINEARKAAATSAGQDRLDLLEALAQQEAGNTKEFLTLSEAFLSGKKESPWRPQLLMKLGEAYFNAQQFTAAKTKFVLAAGESPDTPLAESALFWAGEAALRSLAESCEEEALALWDRVAEGSGDLRFLARLEQGKLDQRRDPAAALQIFDALLKADPPADADARYSALCLKAETITARQPDMAARLQEGLQCFDLIVDSPTASVPWKQQALVRKGACLEALKRDSAALEAYHDAMNFPINSQEPSEAAWHWFFQAGGHALRLLESRRDWSAAAVIADRMAEGPGLRGEAARAASRRLKTENFLFRDEVHPTDEMPVDSGENVP